MTAKDDQAGLIEQGTFPYFIVSEESPFEESYEATSDKPLADLETALERPVKWATQIRDLGDENYVLVEPILILVEEYPNSDMVIARFPEVEAFGEGITDTEAILNLKKSILDLYDELIETNLDTLGNMPKMWLRILKKVVTRA
jgi:hypothetical protein